MNWTKKDEQEMIKEWAALKGTQQLSECYLPHPDKKQNSYWEVHDENNEICAYAFDTAKELQQMLGEVFADETMQDLILPLTVAGLKGRKKVDGAMAQMLNQQESPQSESDASFAIPEFRYVF